MGILNQIIPTGLKSGSSGGAEYTLLDPTDSIVTTNNQATIGDTMDDLQLAGLQSSYTRAQFVSEGGGISYFNQIAIGDGFTALGALYTAFRAKGTMASPTACSSGSILGGLLFGAHDGSNYSLGTGGASGGLYGVFGRSMDAPAADEWDARIQIGPLNTPAMYVDTTSAGVNTISLGTAGTDLVGLWGATPAVQPAAYTPTNVTPTRSFDANSTTLNELADVVGTLIADIQSYGGVG